MFIFFRRVWVFAWKNFWRNIGFSLITILILVMTLISFDVVFVMRWATETTVKLVENRIDVSLLFKPTAEEKKITELRTVLTRMPVVSEFIYKDKDQVLKEFTDRHSKEDGVISALGELGTNPFGPALIIRAKNTSDYEEILKAIDIPEYNNIIEEKTFDDHGPIIKKVASITSRAETTGLALGGILTIVAFLIIFNVIRLDIYTRREEIGIMKLVGATNWFVRLPFLLEVVIYSVLAWLVNLGILYGALYFAEPYLNRFFEGAGALTLTGYFNANFLMYFGGMLAGLIALNIISAGLAMRRYLKI